MKDSSVKNIIMVSVFVALMVVSTFFKITVFTIPFTFQTSVVVLSGMILGAKWGALSILVYILLGLLGFPVFARGSGFGYVFTPTFGYLLGFVLAAFFIGMYSSKASKCSLLQKGVVNALGVSLISLLGALYWFLLSNYVLNTPMEITYVLFYGMLVFLPKDIVFSVIATLIGDRLHRILS